MMAFPGDDANLDLPSERLGWGRQAGASQSAEAGTAGKGR